jgi:trk system potassium uptake protein
MPTHSSALRYAVRLRVLARNLGYLFLMLAALNIAPFLFALFSRETVTAVRYAAIVLGLSLAGTLLRKIPEPRRVQPNEAMVLGCLMFLVAPLLMTYPLSSTGLGFMDALFEAVSGLTTTGLSTVGSLEDMPATLLFSRAWMQWYGGLGIVAFSVALVIRPGISAKDLGMSEPRKDNLLGGTRQLFRQILLFYSGLTVGAVVLFLAVGLSPFRALTFAFSSVSTGGFAPRTESLGNLGVLVPGAVTLITVISAVPLTCYLSMRLRGAKALFGSVQPWGLLVLGLFSALVLFLLFTMTDTAWTGRAMHSLVMAFSAQTTSGFSSIDPAELPPAAKEWLIFSMFIGGGLGSTAGGFKILRLIIFLKVVGAMVHRASLSRHAVYQPSIRNVPLRESEMRDALAVILLYSIVVIFSWIPFLLYGYDPLNGLFEIVSALGTVGLSAGLTSRDLPDLLKGVLCANMLLGRLEILVWLVLFFPGTWIGRHSEE